MSKLQGGLKYNNGKTPLTIKRKVHNMSELQGGLKYDNGKTPWSRFPMCIEKLIAAVLTFGAMKYQENNWQLVSNALERYYSAFRRHLKKWHCEKENIDPETGLPHLIQALTNLIFLMYLTAHQEEIQERSSKTGKADESLIPSPKPQPEPINLIDPDLIIRWDLVPANEIEIISYAIEIKGIPQYTVENIHIPYNRMLDSVCDWRNSLHTDLDKPVAALAEACRYLLSLIAATVD